MNLSPIRPGWRIPHTIGDLAMSGPVPARAACNLGGVRCTERNCSSSPLFHYPGGQFGRNKCVIESLPVTVTIGVLISSPDEPPGVHRFYQRPRLRSHGRKANLALVTLAA
jgi:hypothetical protein